jgi:surface protein
MEYMFEDCESLKTANLSGLNTLKLTNMRELFYCCRSLEQVNLNGLKTSNVTDMSYMFGGCESLKTLDLKGLNTSKVIEMSLMFEECLNLTRLDLSSFNTANVKYADRMFRGCEKLKYVDLYSLDMSKADTMFMFKGCKALDILITPAKINKDETVLPYAMYDRNGKKYTELSNSTANKVLGRTKALAASIFIDVRDPNHPFYKAIYWAVEKGITKGYSDGTFGIDKPCTRGEMVMFLWRYAGMPMPRYVSKSPFKDVPPSHVFYKAILWAHQKGITKGYPDGTFGINRNVSRGESMMFLWRLKGKPEPKPVSVSPFKDVPKTHTFYKAILWGYQKKITNGYTTGVKKGTFGINENCTRGQIVTFLYRARAL